MNDCTHRKRGGKLRIRRRCKEHALTSLAQYTVGMDPVIFSPEMLPVLVGVFILEALSLLLLALNIFLYHNQNEKYRHLLSGMGGQHVWKNPGRVILPVYIVVVLVATIATSALIIFQPHIL